MRGWRTSLLSCQPAARTATTASTALMVLASTAKAMPSSGPNSKPADSVNAVRGKGNTVITVCATKNASGNHGPAASAQARSCNALGSGTSRAIATRITIAVARPTTRARGSCAAVAATVATTVRNVLTTGFTSAKPTVRNVVTPPGAGGTPCCRPCPPCRDVVTII